MATRTRWSAPDCPWLLKPSRVAQQLKNGMHLPSGILFPIIYMWLQYLNRICILCLLSQEACSSLTPNHPTSLGTIPVMDEKWFVLILWQNHMLWRKMEKNDECAPDILPALCSSNQSAFVGHVGRIQALWHCTLTQVFREPSTWYVLQKSVFETGDGSLFSKLSVVVQQTICFC